MQYQVVISHNQSRFIDRFSDIFGCDRMVFVFDAMDELDLRAMKKNNNPNIVAMMAPGNRSANRNAGLSYLERTFSLSESDIIEFFDGDRYPVKYVKPELDGCDILLYTCENDKRLQKLHPGPVSTGSVCNPFYSCGFAAKYGAIRKIEDDTGGKLFNEQFVGWGCEDQYLGILCHKLGIRVSLSADVILAGGVGGDEWVHQDYKCTLQQYVNILRANGLFPVKKH